MINDFDLLLNKCKTRVRKKIVNIAIRILSSILLLSLGIFGYYQWQQSTQQPVIEKPMTKVLAPVVQEDNSTVNATAIPAVVKAVTVATPATATPIASTPPVASQPTPIPTNRLLEVSTASSGSMSPEQTYQRSPKFETALGIARDFYTKEDYVQASVWAKKANQMNREAEEAWLLYAKSYYAQGKKNEAIGVLELYLNYKDSKAASDLIKAWR